MKLNSACTESYEYDIQFDIYLHDLPELFSRFFH